MTRPPPALPVTSIAATSCWSCSILICSSRACFIMPIMSPSAIGQSSSFMMSSADGGASSPSGAPSEVGTRTSTISAPGEARHDGGDHRIGAGIANQLIAGAFLCLGDGGRAEFVDDGDDPRAPVHCSSRLSARQSGRARRARSARSRCGRARNGRDAPWFRARGLSFSSRRWPARATRSAKVSRRGTSEGAACGNGAEAAPDARRRRPSPYAIRPRTAPPRRAARTRRRGNRFRPATSVPRRGVGRSAAWAMRTTTMSAAASGRDASLVSSMPLSSICQGAGEHAERDLGGEILAAGLLFLGQRGVFLRRSARA